MNTNPSNRLILTAMVCLLTASSLLAQHIHVNVSYKVVLHPTSGARPDGAADNAIEAGLARMNELLDSYGRGNRLRLTDPITEVGGAGQANGPSRWFNTDFFSNPGEKHEMQHAAWDNPGPYAWNPNAINIYITQASGEFRGGVCSLPGQDEIIVVSGDACRDAPTVLHEIGHYFNLCHTHGCGCNCPKPNESGECHTEPGDDGVADTIRDLPLWDRDGIALANFGDTYGRLSGSRQTAVDAVFFNLLSYHGSGCGQGVIAEGLTEGQLDRWTDAVNNSRQRVGSGRTWMVDRSARCDRVSHWSRCVQPDIFGPTYGPAGTVGAAVSAASAGGADIILIRPGSYPETLTITKPVTLRATRAGGVTIGQ